MSSVKTCPVCCEVFTAEQNGTRYCSEECRRAYRRRVKVRNCEFCAKEFSGRQKKYCSSECRLRANGQLPDLTVSDELIRLPKKRVKKMSLSEINEAARAEGLSYGQYTAKYHI